MRQLQLKLRAWNIREKWLDFVWAIDMEHGRIKYGAHNWREGMSFSRLYDAAFRHMIAAMEGEDKDPESGLPHEAHVRCCMGFLLKLKKTHPDFDDRYRPERKEQGK